MNRARREHTLRHAFPDESASGVRERDGLPTLVDELNEGPRSAPDPIKDRCLLTIVAGPRREELLRMTSHELVVGRGSVTDEVIDDPFISRQHARFYWAGSELYVEDLGSTNGTYVGSQRVQGRQPLRDGDYVRLGKEVLLRCTLHDPVSERSMLKLYASSREDGLTGCFNRRYFDEQLEAEVSFARRHAAPLALLLCDIDEFKRINDTRGHRAGDLALQLVSKTMRRLLRPEDVLCRYGGDELGVIARGINRRNAEILGDRIRRAVHGLEVWRDGVVSVSVGIAACGPNSAGSAALLVAMADRALYRAKAAGRNCVVSVPI